MSPQRRDRLLPRTRAFPKRSRGNGGIDRGGLVIVVSIGGFYQRLSLTLGLAYGFQIWFSVSQHRITRSTSISFDDLKSHARACITNGKH